MGETRWLALSQQALLTYATRGDALQALSLLRRQLREAGRPAAIGWSTAEGRRAWIDAQAPAGHTALEAAWGDAPARQRDSWWWLPLDHLSVRVGVLALRVLDAGEDAAAFEPLAQAAAALAARCAHASDEHPTDAALLRAALHGAGTYVWEWRPDSDVLTDVDEGLAMLGYSIGQFAPTQDAWNRLIHPDDLDANHAAYLRHERGETEQYEHIYRARAADGRWRWLHERGRIVERALDGTPRRMVGTQSDITTQRELETQAQADRERLALIARHVPGVLYQFVLTRSGHGGIYAYVSERCHALLGVSADEAMADANALFRRIHPEWRERVRASVAGAAATQAQWRCEFPVRRMDGADRWILGVASPRPEPDGSTSLFGYLADVTELRELEAASRDKAAAEAASRAKTEFLSHMSHELRTPLNAVLGFAQLLELSQTPPLPEAHRRPVHLIRQAGEHLLTMIGDLLDLTRIEAGQLSLQIATVPLAPLFDECLALMQGQAATAQVALAAAPVGALALQCDRTRAKQVLLNLLSNAIKYNRAGGAVTLRAAAHGAQVRIDVSDTGVGIAPEYLSRVFEPFQRGAQRSSAIEGTGIGLAVCKSLVELMQGRIEVQSTPGKGSMFSVLLPAASPR